MIHTYTTNGGSKTQPFENQTLKSLVLGWRWVFQVWISSPHCMPLTSYLFRVLRFLISAKLKKYIFWTFFRSYSPTSPSYSPTRLQTKIQILIYLLTSIFTVQFWVGFNLLILCKMRVQLVNDFYNFFLLFFRSAQATVPPRRKSSNILFLNLIKVFSNSH